MRRLLIVGTEVANFPSISWGEWARANPLDYQGLLLDCRDPKLLPAQALISDCLQTLIASGHTAYILLPEAKGAAAWSGAMTLVPYYYLYVEQADGLTLNIQHSDPLFQKYRTVLTKHEICFQLQSPRGNPPFPFVTGISDNVSRAVCGKVQSIYLLHPPAKNLEQKALKVIIEHFKPDLTSISSVPKPSWVEEIASAIPGVSEIQAKRIVIGAEIQKKTEQLEVENERLRALTSWADLLWMEGLPLQAKVSDGLTLLGINTSTADPSAHTSDLVAREGGITFEFEVTGSSGTIGIEKGRQLMQWVSDAPDPTNVKGVLVANAFRNEPPDKRPPTSDRRIFVLELERLAVRYHLALLDARELYRAVCIKLLGKPVDKAAILAGISEDGVVKFQV
jgi:hypothetical protein